MADAFGIDVEACRRRQRRLLDVMRQLKVDLAIVTQIEHVQYLAGPRFGPVFSPCGALTADGRLTLVAPSHVETAAADEVRLYEPKKLSTLRNDQRAASSAVLLDALGPGVKSLRVGVEFSSCGPHLSNHLGTLVDIEPDLYRLRRVKDVDELALLRMAIDGTRAMHERARQIVRPGINELEVFNQLEAAAVETYGEMLTGTGNDYASGQRGGPPRNRQIEAGELYILDLGPAYRGYFADNTRVYAVGGKPTDKQLKAYNHVASVFQLVEEMVKPGVRCQELFKRAHEYLNQLKPFVFDHHLGHGIGLFPHEAPHLNPNWDDVFQEGEVFAVEPGLYHPELRAGIRLENNYLVTRTGVELLTPFPLVLA
jgi:Xaa-Pro aminopeptidase